MDKYQNIFCRTCGLNARKCRCAGKDYAPYERVKTVPYEKVRREVAAVNKRSAWNKPIDL